MTKVQTKEQTKGDLKGYEAYKQYHEQDEQNGSKSIKKTDFKKIEEIRDKFTQAKRARQNNCYWNNYNTDGGDGGTGGDWEKRWATDEKARYQWAANTGTDNYQSNIKSPMSTGRINAFVNEFKKLNLAWNAKPNNDDDRNQARVASKALDWWYQTSNAKTEFVKVADSAATYGAGFFRVFHLEESREYRFPKTDPDKMSEEEKEELKEESKRKTLWGEKEEVITKDDIAIEYIPIREIYPDPNAWCIHGVTRRARFVIRRRFVHIDDFKAMYESNPDAKNIDNVKAASTYMKTDTYDFFRTPEDVIDSQSVELIEYENQLTDEYIVLANDILIINTPLPYNHKEITYHKVDFIKNPNQFYGIGIPDLLMNIQGAQEILVNMMYDYIYRSYNLRYFIDATSFGELSEEMVRTESQLIPIDLSDNRAIGQKVQQLVTAPIGFDAFQLNDLTERSATIATSIDPSQLSLLAANKTATATIQNKEQLQSMIFAVIDNFVNEGWFYSGRQVWKLMQQVWKVPKIRGLIGENKKPEYKKIRLEGIELTLNEDSKDLEVQESNQDYTFFEMTEEYLNTTSELDIMIKPDSIEIMSKSLEMQKMKEEFAQLIPFAVDPSNAQAMQSNPLPMVSAPKLFQRYFDVEGLPQDLLIQPEVREDLEIKKAEEHMTKILKGEKVSGTPGASIAHRKFEYKVLFAIDEEIKQIQDEIDQGIVTQIKQIEEIVAQMPPQFDPATGEPIEPQVPEPEPDAQLLAKLEKQEKLRGAVATHLAIENMPADLIDEKVLMPPAPPMPEAQTPQAPMPPGADMNTPIPNGMPGDPNAVPMPQPMGEGMPVM